MQLEDLWIGDEVRLKKSGRIGKYEGVNQDGKLKIKCDGKIVLTTLGNIELYERKDEKVLYLEEDVKKPSVTDIPKSLDLHMETLAPQLLNAPPERILKYQVEQAKTYLETVIEYKLPRVEIIHGKGTGVLRHEIEHLCSLYDEVRYTVPTKDGGGTEIWLG